MMEYAKKGEQERDHLQTINENRELLCYPYSFDSNEKSTEEKKEIDKDSEGKTTASTPDSVSQKSAAAEMTEQKKAERAEEIMA